MARLMDEFIEEYFTGEFALMQGKEFDNKTLSTLFFHYARSKIYGELKGENKRLGERESELQGTVEEMEEELKQMRTRYKSLEQANFELNQTLDSPRPKVLDYIAKLKQLRVEIFGK